MTTVSIALLSLLAHKSQIFPKQESFKILYQNHLESVPLGSLLTLGKPDTHQNLSNTCLSKLFIPKPAISLTGSFPAFPLNEVFHHHQAQSRWVCILGPLSSPLTQVSHTIKSYLHFSPDSSGFPIHPPLPLASNTLFPFCLNTPI